MLLLYYLEIPTNGWCLQTSFPKEIKIEFLSIFQDNCLFDSFAMITEEPVKGEIESTTEHHGVQEDTEDENLLWNSDQIIIHDDNAVF